MTEPEISNGISATREELYEQVWAEPMRTLAKRYGLSDRGLAKTCDRMRVPVPGRGYWARKTAGQSVARQPLPALPPNSDLEMSKVVARPTPARPSPPPAKPPSPPSARVKAQAAYEALPDNRIVVRAQLRSPHKWVQKTLDAFKSDANHSEPDWQYKPPPRLAIDVSKPLLHRGLCILDALLKGLDRREWRVTVSRSGEDRYKHRFSMWVSVLGHSMYFALREPVRLNGNTVTPSTGNPIGSRRKASEDRTGRLELVVFRGASDEIERRFGDTDDTLLETRLNEFMVDLVAISQAWEDERLRRIAIWEREEAERQRQEEEQKRREDEAAKGRALERQALDWAMSENLRLYVAAVRAHVNAAGVAEAGSDVAMWLDWAEQYAKDLDPLLRPLDELAAERDEGPQQHTYRPFAEISAPPTPHWFFSRR